MKYLKEQTKQVHLYHLNHITKDVHVCSTHKSMGSYIFYIWMGVRASKTHVTSKPYFLLIILTNGFKTSTTTEKNLKIMSW